MNNDYYYDYNSMYKKAHRRKNKAVTYIAVMLVASLISGVTVSGVLYNKFTKELYSVKIEAQNANDAVKQLAAENEQLIQSSNNVSEDEAYKGMTNVNAYSFTEAALAYGSGVTAIAKLAGPSIVGIRMTIKGNRLNYWGISNAQTSEGSGIIISKDGNIMTNYHVVSGADPKSGISDKTLLEVFLPDGREAEATFIGGDSRTDLAVIKINLKNLPAAELGDSSKLEVGELAVAIGNPLGMEFAGSVTVGVISALNRTIELDNKTLSLVQTDAAINSGNSGGALLNSRGQVIGINSAKIAASGVEGLGFAIPINDAKPIVDQLLTFGYVKGRPFIGISGREISDIFSRDFNLPKGIYITEVTAGSGAEKAGIKVNDVLVSLDGKKVETMKDIDSIKKDHKAGDTVSVTVMRNEKSIDLRLTFDEEK